MARVFVPPAEILRQVLPPTALRRVPRPAPTSPPVPPPSPQAKDRISIGPPIPMQQKGPLILHPDDDFTKAPKGRPDAVPSPAAPRPPMATPEPARAADTGNPQPKAPGLEGLRLPPGLGRDLQRGAEGSNEQKNPTGPSIASSLRNFDHKLQTGEIGLPTGTGQQQIHGLQFDPMGADFSAWVTQFSRETYRNWNLPPAAEWVRGHVDIEFTVERDGSVSMCRILNSSGYPALDKAAKNALESSNFLPLPSDYGPKSVTIKVSFFYNYNEAPAAS